MDSKRTLLAFILLVGLASLFIIHHVHENSSSSSLLPKPGAEFTLHHPREKQRLRVLKESLLQQRNSFSFPLPIPEPISKSPHIYKVTMYGADPTGKKDSTNAIEKAISDALKNPGTGFLFDGIVNLGGVQIHLEGGYYMISRPLKLTLGRGNILVCRSF